MGAATSQQDPLGDNDLLQSAGTDHDPEQLSQTEKRQHSGGLMHRGSQRARRRSFVRIRQGIARRGPRCNDAPTRTGFEWFGAWISL